MDLVKTELSENPQNINSVSNNIFSLSRIAKEVANKHGFVISEIKNGKYRTNPITAARNEYFYRALTETDKHYTEIAYFLDMDHTSAAYGAARFAIHNNLPFPRGAIWRSKKVNAVRKYPKSRDRRIVETPQPAPMPKAHRPLPDPHKEESAKYLQARAGSKALLERLREYHGRP